MYVRLDAASSMIWKHRRRQSGCSDPLELVHTRIVGIETASRSYHIPIFVEAKVKSGYRSNTQYTHYNLLRTILDMYDLPLIGGSQQVEPITDIWK